MMPCPREWSDSLALRQSSLQFTKVEFEPLLNRQGDFCRLLPILQLRVINERASHLILTILYTSQAVW